jgi:hypothetical protein
VQTENLGSLVAKRITVTLDDEIHKVLEDWAANEARSVPNLVGYLASKAAREHQQQGTSAKSE